MAAPDETTQLFFTFAELEFLLGSTPGWQRARDAWELPATNSPDETAAAGLASLMVRTLASRRGDEFVLRDDVAGAKGLLTAATSWLRMVQLNHAGVEFVGNLGVGDPLVGHVVVAPVGSGCFEIVGVQAAGPAPEAVASLMTTALSRAESGSVAVSDSAAESSVTTVSLEAGRWSVTTGSDVAMFGTADEASAALASQLDGVLEVAR